ncbi:MAG: hypothetical protein BWY77_01602 [bacterium ADurb.Bin431]|nr:MAG: hypothetical protein BWY77_01602 [bacterium ADurb.Bin431]
MFEAEFGAVGIVVFKIEDVADLRTPPAIDGLVIVADHADIAVAGGEHLESHILGVVGILILVDEDITEAFLIVLEDQGIELEELNGFDEQVIEIHGIVFAQTGLVGGVDSRNDLVLPGCGHPGELFRQDEGVLGGAGLVRDHLGREIVDGNLEIVQHRLDEAVLIVIIIDSKIGGVIDTFCFAAQQACEEGVKGADPHAGEHLRDQLAHAFSHLPRRLVGEGHGEDFARLGQSVGEQPGNAVGEDAGLAAAGAGENEHRSIGFGHRLALGVVEIGRQPLRRRPFFFTGSGHATSCSLAKGVFSPGRGRFWP